MMYCSTTSSQKATGCFRQLVIGQGIGSCSKTMLQLTRPRKTWLALLPMFQEGISWNGPQILLICALLRTYGPGWTRNWGTGVAFKDTAELQVKLIAIRDSITTQQLSKYFRGMRNRMKRVAELHGAHIGK